MELTPWQRFRMTAFLFGAGVVRRMTLGVRVMLIDGEKVFLIRHTYVPGWQLPGGGVEPGETAEESAAREVLEETGYRIGGRPDLFALYHNLNQSTNRDHVLLYVCRSLEKVREFKPNGEIADAGWFERRRVPTQTTGGTLRRIAEVFDNAERDTRW